MRWLPRRRSASSIAMMPVPTRPALRHGQCADCRPHRPGTGERRRAGRGRRCRADGGGAADRPGLRRRAPAGRAAGVAAAQRRRRWRTTGDDHRRGRQAADRARPAAVLRHQRRCAHR
ncbi:hypothetical protein G6F50_015679 [Rhizopus delemar]|uniref:Uncharacterized protein n=1 Tax=Rhizopus delemar TaxID=936053 RepID=A0A9P7C3G4_9FUNG|nr:hypothetical protein G6F50_015679 [Rhizopus delemar]